MLFLQAFTKKDKTIKKLFSLFYYEKIKEKKMKQNQMLIMDVRESQIKKVKDFITVADC